jgi:hypothetical protein
MEWVVACVAADGIVRALATPVATTSSQWLVSVLLWLFERLWKSITFPELWSCWELRVCRTMVTGGTHLNCLAAEEGGQGKATLISEGAYKEMDACVM